MACAYRRSGYRACSSARLQTSVSNTAMPTSPVADRLSCCRSSYQASIPGASFTVAAAGTYESFHLGKPSATCGQAQKTAWDVATDASSSRAKTWPAQRWWMSGELTFPHFNRTNMRHFVETTHEHSEGMPAILYNKYEQNKNTPSLAGCFLLVAYCLAEDTNLNGVCATNKAWLVTRNDNHAIASLKDVLVLEPFSEACANVFNVITKE